MNYTNPKYILMTSAYQMAILMLFNEDISLTLKDIEAATKIAPAQLNPVLGLLVKAKVLLQDEDTYDLNLS
jgi:cullin 1